ncbi:MAG: ABC transporter substrate-binding protein [Spirochaetaceae bacterium]|nr:MAG: ABC transporter substrate-binding protein [Spirochaetaceae bacterium]
MKIHNELIDAVLEIPDEPRRIVSLNSGFTEALFAMGYADRVVGVSCYCDRYVDVGDRRVAGDYLTADRSVLDALAPDLIVLTGGAQRSLALKLTKDGYPVYALGLPESFAGVCDAAILLGALCGDTSRGRDLAWRMMARATSIRAAWSDPVPSVYVELWFGRHVRTIGGRTFIHDIVEIAGGRPVFAANPGSYLGLDIDAIDRSAPDVFLGFHEPEFPVDFAAEARKRPWSGRSTPPVIIVSDVTRGRNLIHDGPSLLDTAEWLQEELRSAIASPPR